MTHDIATRVLRYHDRSKHGFHRFAAGPGHLDWSNQPQPFRRYEGAPLVPLPRRGPGPELPFDAIYRSEAPVQPLCLDSLGDFLRHALGLSAWKSHGASRWALRVNPSSGNLHPTEGFVVLRTAALGTEAAIAHHAPDRHALELRTRLPATLFDELLGSSPPGSFLVGLSSIHWREAWKYGERAFRYCQHDAGHALAALSFSAALQGWELRPQRHWATADIARLLGVDRAEAQHEGEHEEAELLALVRPRDEGVDASETDGFIAPPSPGLLAALAEGEWTGRANRLSPEHVAWEAIDEVARLTRSTGRPPTPGDRPRTSGLTEPQPERSQPARAILKQRRSALAFDGQSGLPLADFERILRRSLPGPHAPWDALGAPPRVHLAFFVHLVEGLAPGLHVLVRRPEALPLLRAACREEFDWERPEGLGDELPFYRLASGRCESVAAQVSCGQDIAGDGAFSLGMLAELDSGLAERGAPAYRELFQETGMIGQVLYLEAEAAGLRATGIGCFFDEPVHAVLGLGPESGHAFQSLYHFTVGGALEDPRLTSEPGYPDES